MLNMLDAIKSPSNGDGSSVCFDDNQTVISFTGVEASFSPVDHDINKIKIANQELKRLLNVKQNGLPEQQNNAIKNGEETIGQTTSLIRSINIKLRQVKLDMKNSKNGDRTKNVWVSNQYNTTLKSFQSSILEFEKMSNKFKDTVQNDFIRQAKIINPEITQFQIQEMLQISSPTEYLEKNLMEAISPEMLDDISILENEHKRIKKMEKSMKEINEYMHACQVLINDNQITINAVQDSVEKTYLDAEAGQKELLKAEEYVRRTRANKVKMFFCCCIFIAIIILFIILFVKKAIQF